MTGWKEWGIGEVVEAGDFQTYVQDQTVQNYATSAARGSALGTAVAEGMVSYLQDTNQLEVYDGSQWVDVGQDLTQGTAGYTALSNGTAGLSYQPVSHNYIINGAMDVWQRGTSLSGTTADVFLADRWFVRNGTVPTTRVISQETFTPADIEATGFGEASFYQRITVTGTTTYVRINQRIEDARTLAGQQVTVSLWARSSSATTVQAILIQDLNDSADTTTAAPAATISSSWSRVSFTVTLPSLSGKTLGAGNALLLILQSGAMTDGTMDFWGVQLEAGSIATPFKRNAPSLQGELAACQRYYVRMGANSGSTTASYTTHGNGFTTSTTNAYIMVQLPVPMRVAPTSVSASNLGIYDVTNSNYAVTAVALIENNNLTPTLGCTVSGATDDRFAQLKNRNNTAGFIDFSAEL